MLIWTARLCKKWLENSLFDILKSGIPLYMLCSFFRPGKIYNDFSTSGLFLHLCPMFGNPYGPSDICFCNKLSSSPPASPSWPTFTGSETTAGGKTCECCLTGNLPANFYFVIVLQFCFNAFSYKLTFVYPTWYRVSNFNLIIYPR